MNPKPQHIEIRGALTEEECNLLITAIAMVKALQAKLASQGRLDTWQLIKDGYEVNGDPKK